MLEVLGFGEESTFQVSSDPPFGLQVTWQMGRGERLLVVSNRFEGFAFQFQGI